MLAMQLSRWDSANFFLFLFVLQSEIKVLEADMLQLPFEDDCFDVVIEKGTMVKLIKADFCFM